MTSTQGRPLHWYWIIGLLFATPPLLAIFGIHLPTQPSDPWLSAHQLPSNDPDRIATNPARSTASLDELAEMLPCVAVLQSDQLLEREALTAIRAAVIAIEEAVPDCDVSWCGDAPSRSGLLRRPRSVIPADDAADRHWERVAVTLKEHPLVTGHILSEDGSTMLLLLDDSTVQTEQIARDILDKHLGPLKIQYWLTGEALMLREDEAALARWTLPVLGIAALVVALVGLAMLRDPRRSVAVAAGPAAALLFAIGWEAFLGLPFNELAAADIPVFVLVLAFADSLHILLAVEEEYGHTGNHLQATRRAMKRMLRPCFLTSITTSLAFASLMLSDQPMVHGFGRNAAVAVAVAFVGVVTAMPLAAAECVRRRRPTVASIGRRQDRWIHRPILFGVRHPAVTIVGFTGLTIACLLYGTQTLYPDDRIEMRLSREEPSYQGLIQCDEKLGGLRQVTVDVQWPENMSDAAIWDILTAIQQQVLDSESFSEPLSILNATSMLSGENSARKLRYARLLAQDRLAQFWNKENRTASIEFRVPDRSVQYIEPDLRQLRSLLEHEKQVWPGLKTEVGGQCLLQSSMVRTTINEMAWSVILAAGTILLVIWVAYRRLSFAMFAILPNTFALAVTVAIRGAMSPSLDIASACAASICLGIAVDDTIHFLEAMRHARGRFGSRMRILNAGHLVGRALMITTVTLLFGFASVFVAPLPTHKFFAGMVVAMLPAALMGDLLILPAILSMFRDLTTEKTDAPQSQQTPNHAASIDESAQAANSAL